jgi:prolyl oligopeptidase
LPTRFTTLRDDAAHTVVSALHTGGIHPRGLWRRTTLEEYRKDSPEWDVVIDVDALAVAEDENWVWAGGGINAPGFTHAVVALSRGGGDASVVREFDVITR